MTGLLTFDADPWAGMDDGLRWYQRDAALAVSRAFEQYRSVLIVLATGMGKTQAFAALAGSYPGKVLVLAHRDELVEQARRRIEQMTGEWVQIEKAEHKAELTTRLVVASVDTMRQQKRLERFPREHFGLIIVDEAHHYTGNTFTRPLDYFHKAKVLGVTATPDRADERALGKTFDHCAYNLGISEGIDLGYLVPIVGREVSLQAIDLSHVGKTGRDLAAGQLDEVMVRAVEGVVRETLRLEPDRQGIAFFPGVKSAEYASEKFNVLQPGSARFLCGQTPVDERRAMVRDFRKGAFKYLCNCQVATEGFDAPSVDLIILARPTLSRALYTQMVGRGTRTLPGVVDRFHGREDSAARRAAVAASAKPNLCVLDFVGNAGKHSLISLEDVLGGEYSDAEVKLAKKKRREGGGDPQAALDAARAELQALAAAIEAKVKSEVRQFDPFKLFNASRPGIVDDSNGARAISPGQWDFLSRAGITDKDLASLGYDDAQKLVRTVQNRKQRGLATYKQLKLLARFGVTNPNLKLGQASAAIDYIKSRGWRDIDPHVLDRITNAKAEA